MEQREGPEGPPGAAWTAETLFAGPGATRAALRATDWTRTSLGPVETWSPDLRAAIRTVLPSRIPMLLWWGPQLVQIFNEAYTPVLGDKYPAAVGQPGAECWTEVWDLLGPMAEAVFAGQGATYAENEQLFLHRHGYLEETYWTFSYSPVHGEDGKVAGVFVATTDVTARVLGDRRMETLRELGTLSIAAADTAADACRAVVRVLGSRRQDLPVLMAYLRSDPVVGDGELSLIASVGLAGQDGDGDRASSEAGLPEAWRVAETGRTERVTGLAARHPGVFRSDGPLDSVPVDEALVLPLQVSGQARPVGVLVVGISPYRELDQPYRVFVELVADRVSTALTDAVAYAAERRRAAALTDLDEAKTRFFSNVSHELRTPLTLIAGPVEESLADHAQPLPPAQRERLEMVRRNAGRLRRLVDNILDFVRIESGRMQPEPLPTDLAELTRGIAEGFGTLMRGAGLAFVVDAPPLPREAHLDRDMWEKIVVNLLSNAVKYTMAGEVRLTLTDAGDHVLLVVADTGVGIPPDQQPLLFQRFHRVRGSAGRSHEGAGIGLALVHELTVLHGGTVSVRSAPGAGSTFTVALPYGTPAPGAKTLGATPAPGSAPVAAGPAGAAPSRSDTSIDRYVAEAVRWLPDSVPAPPPSEASGATVLVVEDNADLRAFLRTLLEPFWRVEVAPDGRAALEHLDAARPDLVLTDVMMPRMDGFELLKALRADPRTASVPVLMLSGRAGEGSAVEGLDAGADDYLIKPFSSQELLARVRANLELARLRTQESAWRAAVTESLQEAFWVADESGTVLEVNGAFRRLIGSDPALPVPTPYPWWPDARDEPDLRRQAEAALRDGLAGVSGRVRVPMRHADGRRIWAEAVFSSLRDPDTGRRTYVGTLRDITDELLATARQEASTRLSGGLAEAQDVHQVYDTALGELRRLFGTPQVAMISFDGPGRPTVVAGPPMLDEPVRRGLAAVVHSPDGHVEYDSAGRISGMGAVVDAGAPMTAVWMEFSPPRPPVDVDSAHLPVLCGTIAHALHRARSYDVQRTVALTLQRSILGPAELPAGFAVRYEPAVRPLEVGGDWYDVVELAGDMVGVVVGDCVGRGLAAAAVMGQLRSAGRALLLQAKGPGEVLAALDDFARLIPGARCTTVFCAIVEQATGRIRYATAGHPPGIVVHQDGGHVLLDQARSLPLATVPVAVRPEAATTLRAGSILLLYTDGLVERRTDVVDAGIDEVVRTVVDERGRHQHELADRVITATRPAAGYDDDVALLVYRHRDQEPFTLSMPAQARELGAMRAALTGWLAGAGVPDGAASDVVIAVTEACANAIEHGYRFAGSQRVTVRMSMHAGRLEGTVRDAGSWIPPRAGGQPLLRGRGRMMMRALMDEAVIEGGPLGTTVRLVKDVRDGH